MLPRFFFFCFLSALTFNTSFAAQALGPPVLVLRDPPYLVVGPSPETVLRGRLRIFFNEYRVSEGLRHQLEERVVAQLLNAYGESVSFIHERYFLPFLLDCFNIPRAEHAQIMNRVEAEALSFNQLDSCANLVRAVYGLRGLDLARVDAHVQSVVDLINDGVCFLEAYWLNYFRTHGLNDVQAHRAAAFICDSIKRGISIKHAYWHSVLMQFGLHKSRIHALVERAVALEGQGLSGSEIVTAVLFATEEGIDLQRSNVFRLRIAQGLAWVEAFYYAHYNRVMSAPDSVLRAAQAYVADLDRFGFQPGRYQRIIYEQYGFPQALARAAFDCLKRMREAYPECSGARLFWWAAFRVLGVSEALLEDAYKRMLNAESEVGDEMRSFERAYVEVMGGGAIDLEFFFSKLARALFLPDEQNARVQTLLEALWEARFPNVSRETRAGALRGFLQSPATLPGILAMLEMCNKVSA